MALPVFNVIIPARLGSTRLPNKPLLKIAGNAMIVHVAKRAQLSGAHQVVVATDSQEIVDVCAQEGIRALLTRSDHLSGTDRLAEAVDLLSCADNEIIVNLQGDEPLIDPSLLLEVAVHLQNHPDCSMATAAYPINDPVAIFSPQVVKVVCDAQDRALYFSRAPIPWLRTEYAATQPPSSLPNDSALQHIGLYAYRANFLRRFPHLTPAPIELAESLEQLRVLWHGERIAILRTRHTPMPGVDTAEDLAHVEAILSHTSTSS